MAEQELLKIYPTPTELYETKEVEVRTRKAILVPPKPLIYDSEQSVGQIEIIGEDPL